MREAFKSLARGIAFVAVIPALASYAVRSALLGKNRALEGSTQMLANVPGIPGQYLRQAFLARVIQGCAPTATISFGTIFSSVDARIGDRAYIGPGCFVGFVHIEADVLVGSGVHMTSGARTHGTEDVNRPIREQEREKTLVRIGAGAWIGSAAVIMADVGPNSVIGAGAVVTRTIPPAVVAAGVPARVLKPRT